MAPPLTVRVYAGSMAMPADWAGLFTPPLAPFQANHGILKRSEGVRREAPGRGDLPIDGEGGMSKLTKKLVAKGQEAAEKAYRKVETRVLVAEGKKSIRAKTRTVGKVSRKAAKTGMIVGALAAAGVVYREIRKRKKLA
jgi:hypothetical protein